MKKFVTTLIALFSAAAMALGLSACFDEEPENTPDPDETETEIETTPDPDEAETETGTVVYEQVTEEQWKNALSIFTRDPDLINIDELNLYTYTESDTNYGVGLTVEIKIDNVNKTYYHCEDFYSDGVIYNCYVWQETDGTVYDYYEYVDEEGVSKYKNIFEETYTEGITGGVEFGGIGFVVLAVMDLGAYNDYAVFEYNEETGSYFYTYVVNSDEETVTVNVHFYFKDGKLIKAEVDSVSYSEDFDQEMITNYVETYVYGETTVTIPEEVLNFEN